jgi:hypothetical protein
MVTAQGATSLLAVSVLPREECAMAIISKDRPSYLESRRWMLEAYDVAAAEHPAACAMRQINERGECLPLTAKQLRGRKAVAAPDSVIAKPERSTPRKSRH